MHEPVARCTLAAVSRTVVVDGPAFRMLASNVLGERTFASLAPSANAIYVRTGHALYRIEEP